MPRPAGRNSRHLKAIPTKPAGAPFDAHLPGPLRTRLASFADRLDSLARRVNPSMSAELADLAAEFRNLHRDVASLAAHPSAADPPPPATVTGAGYTVTVYPSTGAWSRP